MSEREYDDFELGSSSVSGATAGCVACADGRRPAFDGMELQMADFRYNPEARPSKLTGGLYRAVEPRQQVYKPTEWNHYEVTLRGDRIVARLNGVLIHDLDLSKETKIVKRHDNTDAPPIKDRPRRGHLGFQELSRDDGHVMIRNAFIRVLD